MKKKLSTPSANSKSVTASRIDSLHTKVSSYIDNARQVVQRSIDTQMVKAYWLIGRDIVEEEQHGQERAQYGQAVLKNLSIKLRKRYKKGFGVDTLENIRNFYITYQEVRISESPLRKLANQTHTIETILSNTHIVHFPHNLSWAHYILLIKIRKTEARRFYELEASKNNWSSRELKRQIGSMLFDRLSHSKDKADILKLAYQGQEINTAEDALKEPLVLEFLGLPERHHHVESRVEEALLNHLQQFLLELGKGFAFVARQKRITLESDTFYCDLVFYHIILKCYVTVDIKTHVLTHADLGQMQLYVNYYDQEIKMSNDNPTLGLVLCTEKNEAIVKYTLGDKANQIFAKKYQFHLPTEAELEKKLKKEIEAIQHNADTEHFQNEKA